MSVWAKGVSRGVHNIAFLLSPDRFRAFDLYFFWLGRRRAVLLVSLVNVIAGTTVWLRFTVQR
jgi:hypothetical protein